MGVRRNGSGIDTNRDDPQGTESEEQLNGLQSYKSYNGYKGNQVEEKKLTNVVRKICCTAMPLSKKLTAQRSQDSDIDHTN